MNGYVAYPYNGVLFSLNKEWSCMVKNEKVLLKPRARNSLWVSHMGSRDLSTCCLSGCISRKLDHKQSCWDSDTLIQGMGILIGSFAICATRLAPMGEPWKYYNKWKKLVIKATYYVIPLTWNAQNRKIQRNRKVSVCQGQPYSFSTTTSGK